MNSAPTDWNAGVLSALEARHEKIVAAKIPPNTAYIVDSKLQETAKHTN